MLHQAVAVEHRMDRRARRHWHALSEPARQELAELRATECGFSFLSAMIAASTRIGAGSPPGPGIAAGLRAPPVRSPVLGEELVPGPARDAELLGEGRHRLLFQPPADEAKRSSWCRLSPRHPHFPPQKGGKCNPCVLYVLSPMSPAAEPRNELTQRATESCGRGVAGEAAVTADEVRLVGRAGGGGDVGQVRATASAARARRGGSVGRGERLRGQAESARKRAARRLGPTRGGRRGSMRSCPWVRTRRR